MKLITLPFATTLIFAALLTGCVPWPHFVTIVPEVNGRVVQSGEPIVDAAIFTKAGSSKGTSCDADTLMTKTDRDGNFIILPRSQFRLFLEPLVEPIEVNEWELCIEHNETKLVGLQSVSFHRGTDALVISCDIDQRFDQHDGIVRRPPLQGVCRVVSRRMK
jgi:hypothetical protein